MSSDALTQKLMIYFFGSLIAILLVLTMVSNIKLGLARSGNQQEIRNAQSWPAVDGEVTNFSASEVLVVVPRGASRKDYLVTVSYQYDVKNKIYQSKQDRFLDHPFNFTPENVFIFWDQKQLIYTREEKQKLEKEYGIGSHHSVCYDVNNPATAFIDVNCAAFN